MVDKTQSQVAEGRNAGVQPAQPTEVMEPAAVQETQAMESVPMQEPQVPSELQPEGKPGKGKAVAIAAVAAVAAIAVAIVAAMALMPEETAGQKGSRSGMASGLSASASAGAAPAAASDSPASSGSSDSSDKEGDGSGQEGAAAQSGDSGPGGWSGGNGGGSSKERVWVVDSPARTETVHHDAIWTQEPGGVYTKCTVCGADITGNEAAHGKQHASEGIKNGSWTTAQLPPVDVILEDAWDETITIPEEGHWEYR